MDKGNMRTDLWAKQTSINNLEVNIQRIRFEHTY